MSDSPLAVPVMDVSVRGETLTLTPLTLGQIGPFITAARPVIGRAMVVLAYARANAQVETGTLLLDLLEQDAPAIAGTLAVVTGRDADWIAGAGLTEVVALVEAVVALNEDFFARRLPALLSRAVQALPEAMTVTDGDATSSTSGSSSSATATPSTL